MNKSGLAMALKGKIRRFFLPKVHPEYVNNQLSCRDGECLQCGQCCRLLYRCPFLLGHGKNIRCLIYNLCRPQQCKLFPIDERDLEEIGGPCGYSFKRYKDN